MQNRVHHTVLESPAVRIWNEGGGVEGGRCREEEEGGTEHGGERRTEKRAQGKRKLKEERKRERERGRLGKDTAATKGWRNKRRWWRRRKVATGQSPRTRIYITVPALTHGYT